MLTIGTVPAPLRLVSTQGTSVRDNNAGRLEILAAGEWGIVCSNGFDSHAATVACRRIGYMGYIFYSSVESAGYVLYRILYSQQLKICCNVHNDILGF